MGRDMKIGAEELEQVLREVNEAVGNRSRQTNLCNCASNKICPLDAKCKTMKVVYRFKLTSEDREYFYIGTSSPFFFFQTYTR